MLRTLSTQQLRQINASAYLAQEHSVVSGVNYLVVDLNDDATRLPLPDHWPGCVVIGLGRNCANTDVTVTSKADLEHLTAAIDAQPVAAATLTQLLRHNALSSAAQGLLAESMAYSMLQQSEGFRTWLAQDHRPSPRQDPQPILQIDRETALGGATLTLTFNRPDTHNAYSQALKDALCEALQLAESDPTIRHVRLAGNGPSFCAGGDLSEFGSVVDAAEAHLSRTTRSAAILLNRLNCHTSTQVHGACIGAGIELPAFTQHISAHPDSYFVLPEVAMGLVPGAGGTVSVLKRIGRHRCAWMALSGARVNAATALQWGLIDRVEG